MYYKHAEREQPSSAKPWWSAGSAPWRFGFQKHLLSSSDASLSFTSSSFSSKSGLCTVTGLVGGLMKSIQAVRVTLTSLFSFLQGSGLGWKKLVWAALWTQFCQSGYSEARLLCYLPSTAELLWGRLWRALSWKCSVAWIICLACSWGCHSGFTWSRGSRTVHRPISCSRNAAWRWEGQC